jgi:hypothetical protein
MLGAYSDSEQMGWRAHGALYWLATIEVAGGVLSYEEIEDGVADGRDGRSVEC